jgi:hypothetical protein
MTRAHSLLEAYRLLGWKLPFVSLVWLARPCFIVVSVDLHGPIPTHRQSAITRWSTLTEADLSGVSGIDPTMTSTEIRRRLGERQTCFLGWVGDELAYYRWESSEPAYLKYLDMTFRPLAGQVCVYNTYTAPRFRRGGIETAARNEWHRRHRAQGLLSRISIVAWWNTPSLRASMPAGARVVGSVGYWNLVFHHVYFATGAVQLEPPSSFRVLDNPEQYPPESLTD